MGSSKLFPCVENPTDILAVQYFFTKKKLMIEESLHTSRFWGLISRWQTPMLPPWMYANARHIYRQTKTQLQTLIGTCPKKQLSMERWTWSKSEIDICVVTGRNEKPDKCRVSHRPLACAGSCDYSAWRFGALSRQCTQELGWGKAHPCQWWKRNSASIVRYSDGLASALSAAPCFCTSYPEAPSLSPLSPLSQCILPETHHPIFFFW